MNIIIQGILTGLVLSVYVGATFFTIVETSIRRGPAAAMILNTGVWFSDITFIFLAYYGAAELMRPFTDNTAIKILAGIAFLIFGISYFARKPKETVKPLTKNTTGIAILFFKGFAINTLNPGVFIFWFGTMVMAVGSFEFSGRQVFTYFASVISTVVVIDLIKVLSSTQLRRIINDTLMSRIFRITGVILIIFGLFLIIKAIGHF